MRTAFTEKEFVKLSYSSLYDDAAEKGRALFSHPFQFYYQQNLLAYRYESFMPKMEANEIMCVLSSLFEHIYREYSTRELCQEKLCLAPSYLVHQLIVKYNDIFSVSVRLSEMVRYISRLYKDRSEFGQILVLVLGIFQTDMLNASNFPKVATFFWHLLLNTKLELNEQNVTTHQHRLFCDAEYAHFIFQQIFESHPWFEPISAKFNDFCEIQQKYIRNAYANGLVERRFPGVDSARQQEQPPSPHSPKKAPNKVISQLLAQEPNVTYLTDRLAAKCQQLDKEGSGLIKYEEFLKVLADDFSVDTEDEMVYYQVADFKRNLDEFNYKGFINKIITENLPNHHNEKKLPVLGTVLFLVRTLIDQQKKETSDYLAAFEAQTAQRYPFYYQSFKEIAN